MPGACKDQSMTELTNPLDLLVVAPHPDDAEISVGGIILKSVAQGKRVGILELTNGEPTPHGTHSQRQLETAEATQRLGIHWRHQLDLPNRKLENTIGARRQVAEVFRLVKPSVILAPYWEDSHPDHVAASALIDAARFWSKLSRTDMAGERFYPPRIYYYWSIHLRIHPKPAFVVDISEHIDQKIKAVEAYETQFGAGSPGATTMLQDVKDRARYWGWSIERGYGEPLGSREEIRIDDLQQLL